MASDKGFTEASLGPFVYRTETAGIMACHAFNLYVRQ
jgi:16S rRNA U1498 N3-methylase RsmE